MAEGFDSAKAATDLKQLLKMSDRTIPQDEVREDSVGDTRNNKNDERTNDFETAKGSNVDGNPLGSGAASNSSSIHTNSNGNALLAALVSYESSTESEQQKQKDSATNKDHQSALKLKEDEPNRHRLQESKNTSSGSTEKRKTEIRNSDTSKEIDNVSVKRSQVKSEKKSTEVASVKNVNNFPKRSQQTNSPAHSRNSSANGSQKKNYAEKAESSRHSQQSTDRSVNENLMHRNDEKSQANRAGESQSSRVNNKPLPVKLGEMDLPSEFLMLLEENKMHQLKKRSMKFPKAMFFCRLCDYHLDLKEDCEKHIRDSRHCHKKETSEVDATLRSMPMPSENQIAALTAAVDKVYEEHGINEQEQKQRAGVVSQLEKIVKEKIPDVAMFMYGSSLTGFGLKTADINVNLTSTDKDKKLTSLLMEVYTILKDKIDSGFSNVRSNFAVKVPGVLLTDDLTGLTLNVTIHCYNAHCSSELLSIYSDFDIRVRKLAVTFRYWAHLCGLDRQHEGFIPPQALNLMVIYFLQSLNPQIVPIIQPPRVSGEEVGDFSKDAPKFKKMRAKVLKSGIAKGNDVSVGELWLKMLRFYCLEFDTPSVVVSIRNSQDLSRHSKPWNSKKLAVEDPYMLKKNITRMTNSSHVYKYWQDSLRRAVHYFGLPRNFQGMTYIPIQAQKKVPRDSNEASLPVDTIGEEKQTGVKKAALNGSKEDQTEDVQIGSDGGNCRKDPTARIGQAALETDFTAPVVIAPNPLLSCRISPPSKTVHKMPKADSSSSNEPQILSGTSVPHSSHDRKYSDTGSSNQCLLAKQISDDADILEKQQSSSVIPDDNDRVKSSVLSDTIPVDSVSLPKPVCPSQQSSLSFSSPEQLNNQNSRSISLLDSGIEVATPQPADNTDSSQNIDDGIHTFALSCAHVIVNKAIDEMMEAQSYTSACESNEENGALSEKSSLHCSRHYEATSQNAAVSTPDEEVTSDKQLLSTTLISSSICESDNVESAHLSSITDTNVQQVHIIKPADLDDQDLKSNSDLLSKETTVATSIAESKREVPEGHEDVFSILAQRNCYYEFSKENLTDGKGPILVCLNCDEEGHLKNACPENELPEILPLPSLTPFHVKVLSETLNKVPAEVGLSEEGLAERELFMKALEEFIQGQFKDAKLALFGSSCNGFGFDKSDMDICLTFTQRKVTDKSWLIESLARKMKQHPDLTDVQAIPTAKVPIVKFTVKKTGQEGDISLYNILAQQNTKLLLCYSKIDPRVCILGYTIKTFAKVCDIGDASRGSLSSYSYVLMMLYYLQQVKPPVVPVLQELYNGEQKPKLMIDGWDAWFMDDLSQLDELWPEKGKNEMSVAELWLGFLRFYVEEFKYKEYVVSIRQKELLTRFDKLWNGSCIAIEDPFDSSHNLGSGLTSKMNNFIFKTFINGRMLYGSPVDENMEMFNKYQSPSDYFFDTDLLSECRPPNVRGCRRCGKIGHLVRHCPTAHKDKEEEQKRLQQQLQKQQQQLQQQQLERSNSSPQQLHPQLQQLQKQRPPQPQQQHRQPQPQQHYQPQQQLQRQPQLQRLPLPQQQQQQQRTQLNKQQQNGREMRDRREQDHWKTDPNANINRNSSAPYASGLPFNLTSEALPPAESLNLLWANMARFMLATSSQSPQTFANHPNLQPVNPATIRGLQPQVYPNANFQQQLFSQQQQRPHRPVMLNGPAHPSPSFMPHPSRHNLNTFNFSPPRVQPNMFNQPRYTTAPSSYNSWPPQNNNSYRGLQAQSSLQYSNGNSANFQGMNAWIQGKFANTRGQISDTSFNKKSRRK